MTLEAAPAVAARGFEPRPVGVGMREARGVRRALPDVESDRAVVLAQGGDEVAAVLGAGVAWMAVEAATVKDQPLARHRVLVGAPGPLAHRLLEAELGHRVRLRVAELTPEDETYGHRVLCYRRIRPAAQQ